MSKKLLTLRPPPLHRGAPDYWLDAPAAPWQRNAWTPSAPPTIDPIEYSTEQAVRVPSWQADVLVPLGQSLATGAFVLLVSGTLAIWQGWDWQLPVMLSALAGAGMWLTALTDTRGLLRSVETYTGKDLDQDGHIGTHTTSINVRVEQEGRGPRDLFLQFEDVRPEQLNELFRGALRGDSLSETKWTGGGKLFSKKRFRAVRDGLMDADLLRWQNEDAHAQGLALTKSGQAVLTRWCEDYAGTHTHAPDGMANSTNTHEREGAT